MNENNQGEVLNIGRKSRIVPTSIKRAVLAKHNDGCAFPGCSNSRFLHIHHEEFTNDYVSDTVEPPFYDVLFDQYEINEDYLDDD